MCTTLFAPIFPPSIKTGYGARYEKYGGSVISTTLINHALAWDYVHFWHMTGDLFYDGDGALGRLPRNSH